MCQRCKDAIDKAMELGATKEEAMDWLWSETPFPFAPPGDEQVATSVTESRKER